MVYLNRDHNLFKRRDDQTNFMVKNMNNKILSTSIAVAILMSTTAAYAGDSVNVSMPTNNPSVSEYKIALTAQSGKNWTYTVSQVRGKELSHWDLSLGSCLSKVTSTGGGSLQPSGDPSNASPAAGADSSVKGSPLIKWDTTGGTFTITMDKVYAKKDVPVLAKTAAVYGTGMVSGPDCSQEVLEGSTNTGSTGTTDTGSTNTGSTGTTDTGSTNTGSTDTTDTGSTNTGSTGTTDTGSTNTGSTGTTDTGSTNTGSTGTTDTSSTNTGTGTTDTGSTNTGSTGTTDTGSTNTGSTGTTDTGSTNTGSTTSSGDSSKCTTASKAPKSTNVSWADSKGTNGYDIELVSVNGKTWTYRVTQTSGKALSHWTLGIPACNTHIASSTSTDGSTAQIGKDASIKDIEFSGIKWNSEGGVFSFTLDNDYAATTVDVLAKAGSLKDGGYSTSTIMGPDCSALATSCSDKPLSGEQDVVGIHVWKRVTATPISPESYEALDKSKVEPGIYAIEKIDASGKAVDIQVEMVK
jgi:hypothetical protein